MKKVYPNSRHLNEYITKLYFEHFTCNFKELWN